MLLLCRFAFKTPILLAHHILTGRDSNTFPPKMKEGKEIASKISLVVMETRTRIWEAKLDAFVNQR